MHLYIWWICLNVQCPLFFQYDGWQCWSRKYLSSNHCQVLMRSMMKMTLWSVQQGKEDTCLPIIHQMKMLPWSGHRSSCPLMPLQELIKVVAPFGAASQSTFTVMPIQQWLEQSIGSLQHRWSTIQECCNKWKSCLAQVARHHPSGVPLQKQVSTLFMLFKTS